MSGSGPHQPSHPPQNLTPRFGIILTSSPRSPWCSSNYTAWYPPRPRPARRLDSGVRAVRPPYTEGSRWRAWFPGRAGISGDALGIVYLAMRGTARSCVAGTFQVRWSGRHAGFRCCRYFPKGVLPSDTVRCGRDGSRTLFAKTKRGRKEEEKEESSRISFLVHPFSFRQNPICIFSVSAPTGVEPRPYIRRLKQNQQQKQQQQQMGTYSESSIPHPSICSIHLARQHFSEYAFSAPEVYPVHGSSSRSRLFEREKRSFVTDWDVGFEAEDPEDDEPELEVELDPRISSQFSVLDSPSIILLRLTSSFPNLPGLYELPPRFIPRVSSE